MNAFTTLLVAVALAALVIKLSSLFGMKVNNPDKVPLSSSMGVIEKKYKDINGAAVNAYPAIVLRDDDGTSRKLRLVPSSSRRTMACLLYTSPSPRD